MNGATTRTRKNAPAVEFPLRKRNSGPGYLWLTEVPTETITASRIAAVMVANIAP